MHSFCSTEEKIKHPPGDIYFISYHTLAYARRLQLCVDHSFVCSLDLLFSLCTIIFLRKYWFSTGCLKLLCQPFEIYFEYLILHFLTIFCFGFQGTMVEGLRCIRKVLSMWSPPTKKTSQELSE